jgi:hypothetical protein
MKRKDLLKTQSLFYTTAPLRFDHISAFLLQNGLWSLKFAFKLQVQKNTGSSPAESGGIMPVN